MRLQVVFPGSLSARIRGLMVLLVTAVLATTVLAVDASADEADLYGDAEPSGPCGGPYAVIHYVRANGDYGDQTTGDFNDYWGLHLWGDVDEVVDWVYPKPFIGEDEYGRFAWVKVTPDAANVGVIVHRGDTKDATDADRFFDPSATPEIWLAQDDPTVYTSQADAQGFVTIRYHRDDGDYGTPSPDHNTFWGLHLWGDAIDPSEGTEWVSPKPPTGIDDYGAYWHVQIADSSMPVNFIIHRGDAKDPGPDQSFVPAFSATAWIQSGDETIYPQRGAVDGVATLHYHRPDGDYGDPTSPDYNDFWGMHTWGGADEPGWTTPRTPSGLDMFGAVFEVPLFDDAADLSYILHRGDGKDPGPDQSWAFSEWGYEVWQLSGGCPSDPTQPNYVLPIRAVVSADTEPPMWVVPAGITVGTDPDAATAIVSYTATATDNVGVVSSSCTPASGSTFAVGTTAVTCTADDAAGNTGSATFDVTVLDTEAPRWTVPADITAIATGLDGATVSYAATATDNIGVVASSCMPGSSSTFPLGATTVVCTATDAAGNAGTATFDVTIDVDEGSTGTLIDEIADLALGNGVERSLQAPLKQITKLLTDNNPNNDQAGCDKLDEFTDKVAEKLTDGSLTVAEADTLTSFAEAIKLEHGCS